MNGGKWVSTFQSAREAIPVPVPGIDVAGSVDNASPLAHWAYEAGFSADRFALIQGTMVTELRAFPSETRFREVARRVDALVDQLGWHLQAMVDGRLEEYSKQVRDLEDYVDKTANSFTDQMSTMLKTVSETVLAAIGVFFASLVAATFKDPFNSIVFIVSMLAFAGYVWLFPYHFGLKLQRERRTVLENDYADRRTRFRSILSTPKVGHIEGQRITKGFEAFDRAYDHAKHTYFALAGLSAAAAVMAAVITIIQPSFSNASPASNAVVQSTPSLAPFAPSVQSATAVPAQPPP